MTMQTSAISQHYFNMGPYGKMLKNLMKLLGWLWSNFEDWSISGPMSALNLENPSVKQDGRLQLSANDFMGILKNLFRNCLVNWHQILMEWSLVCPFLELYPMTKPANQLVAIIWQSFNIGPYGRNALKILLLNQEANIKPTLHVCPYHFYFILR